MQVYEMTDEYILDVTLPEAGYLKLPTNRNAWKQRRLGLFERLETATELKDFKISSQVRGNVADVVEH